MGWYSNVVSKWPWLVCLIVIILMISCGAVVFLLEGLPDFSEPTAGFETRNTELKRNYYSWQNLYDFHNYGLWNSWYSYSPSISGDLSDTWNSSSIESRRKRSLHVQPTASEQYMPQKSARRQKRVADETCYSIYQSASDHLMFYIVYEASSSATNLFAASALRSMCEMSDDVLMTSSYVSQPCSGLLIGEVVALMEGTTCTQLTEADVTNALATIQSCLPYYFSDAAIPCLEQQVCTSIPVECINPFVVLHYMTDSDFLDPTTNSTALTYSLQSVYLQEYRQLEFYLENLESAGLDNGVVRISGIDSDFKFELFDRYLVADMALFILAMALILIIMIMYLRSFAMTIATISDVLFSFLLAYFLYFFVFRFPYFPFMNLLTGLILIAIAADDVFIFVDTFEQMKSEYPAENLPFWLSKTMKHAALSILVTSLTTAVAFFANFVSEITAVKCFGIFSGTAILCNFLFMITWVPAFMICVEWFDSRFNHLVKCCSCYEKLIEQLHKISHAIFGKALPFVVEKLWPLWLILGVALGVGGIILVFVTPKLKLPSSEEFQVFRSDHPITKYDNELQYEFRFAQVAAAGMLQSGLTIHFIWGVESVDNGNHLDPFDEGTLSLSSSFDLSKESSQTFLSSFCSKLHNASFVSSSLETCAIDIFNDLMTSACINGDICCGYSAPPFPPDNFTSCFEIFHKLSFGGMGVSYFDSDGVSRAYRLEVETTQQWTAKYNEMEVIYQSIESFMEEAMSGAPTGMKNAFFSGYFNFYDLQRALSRGTYIAIGLSLAFALLVMLFTSLNVVITLYALLTIALSIFVTIGILVLLGWELNILESVTISLAVGLSIDFAIHYGVAYRLSTAEHRLERTRESFRRVGGPVTMAAITTFLAGAAIMPTRVLAYSQLGTFLMLVMVVSWVFATFFFQSLCRIVGPRGNFAQISWPAVGKQKSDCKVGSVTNVRDDVVSNVQLPVTPRSPNSSQNAFANLAFVSSETL